MTTRRAVLRLTALLLPALALAACGQQTTATPVAATTAVAPPAAGSIGAPLTTVAPTAQTSSAASALPATSATALAGSVTFFSWGFAAAVAERKQFCADFEKEHPGTTCTFSLSSGVYLDKLLTMAAGGDAPDVFFVSPTDWKDTTWTFSALPEAARHLTSGTGSTQVFGNLPHPGDNREWMTYVWSNGATVTAGRQTFSRRQQG